MESFSLLKRRTTDILHNVSQNLPSMPMPSVPAVGGAPRRDAIKGTWERIEVPPVPRSSHSLDIVQGSAYIFGGEIEPREPVDNCMHVINLPWSGAGADYYKIKPVAAKPDDRPQQPEPEAPATTEAPAPAPAQAPAEAKKPEKETKESDDDSDDDSEEDSEEDSEDDSEDDSDDESTEAGAEKPLDDVPLASPGLPAESKAKGKQPAGPEPLELGDVPAPRVGHASAVIGSRIFLFGGRGGP
ncbi:hypothetical protein NW754_009061 [Fusarium falciforme]|nr:hypothetical protein NW754_009061 [Fusarium falciforme]